MGSTMKGYGTMVIVLYSCVAVLLLLVRSVLFVCMWVLVVEVTRKIAKFCLSVHLIMLVGETRII